MARMKADATELLLELTKQTYEMGEECARTVYFSTTNVTEALLPLLLRSNSGRIVNLSATMGKLQHVKNEKAKRELNNIETLKKDRLDEMLSEFLREDKLEAEGWPTHLSAYVVSRATVNAYTRLLAGEHPRLCVNCVFPDFVKTDINSNNGTSPVEDGARGPVMLALLPYDGRSGCFFAGTEVSGF